LVWESRQCDKVVIEGVVDYHGKTNISGSFAKRLEYALGIPASFWMNLQKNYDLELAEYEDRNNLTDQEYDIYARMSPVLEDIYAVRDEKAEEDKDFGVIQARKLFKLASLENIALQRTAIVYRASRAVGIDEYVAFAWHALCNCYLDRMGTPQLRRRNTFCCCSSSQGGTSSWNDSS